MAQNVTMKFASADKPETTIERLKRQSAEDDRLAKEKAEVAAFLEANPLFEKVVRAIFDRNDYC